MSTAYITLVGKMKTGDGEPEDVTIEGYADVIAFTPGSPPPRPHPGDPPGIWGPPGPWVTPPIANVPGVPGYTPPGSPPGIWGPPGPWIGWWVPGAPGDPDYKPPAVGEEPPFKKVVAWTPTTGWVVVWVPTGDTVTPSK